MVGSNGVLPLDEMRVMHCTQIMAGPFCTLLLADMGADVIKIERPKGGDDIRHTGILDAYVHRLKTGQGQKGDASLLGSGIACTFWESASYFSTGQVPQLLGSANRLSAPYQSLRTGDGYMNLGAANEGTWEAFCRGVGLEERLADPRFTTNSDWKARETELAALLEDTLRTQSTDHLVKLLEEVGVPAGPIYDLAHVYDDPQVHARDMLVELEDPQPGTIKHIRVPVKLSHTPGSIRRRAPALGEHSREVLLEAGYSVAEVEGLVEQASCECPQSPVGTVTA